MALPEYQKSKYSILKPGKYSFVISDPPKQKRFGKAVGIVLKFIAIDSSENQEKSSCLIWPWSDEYRDLKELIGSREEIDWVGKEFEAEIVHEMIKGEMKHQIRNVQFPNQFDEEEENEKEENGGDVPPPPPPSKKKAKAKKAKKVREEDAPGPGEGDDPGEEEDGIPF